MIDGVDFENAKRLDGAHKVSNFIKLTRRGKRRCTLRNDKPIWINVNRIISIEKNPRGGSLIILHICDLWERCIFVSSEPWQVLKLIEEAIS